MTVVGLRLGLLALFLGLFAWGIHGSFHAAWNDLKNADPAYFVLACAAVAAYYLVFVVGWVLILADWGVHISYATSLRAEMVSMLAKYVPGGVWTPAARVVAARRAGITDAALVTVSILVEAGISAVAGVVVFVSAAGTSPLSFMAPFVFAIAVLVFAAEGGLVSRLFHSRPLKWLGTVSYSIYLTHFFVVLILPTLVKRVTGVDLWTPMPLADGQWVMAFGRNDLEGTLLYGLALALTFAFSAFTYRWVETPGREWTRRWLARPESAPRAQAVRP